MGRPLTICAAPKLKVKSRRTTQICSVCRLNKVLTEFNVSSAGVADRSTTCRVCAKEYGKRHYQENKAAYAAKSTAWRKAHPKRCAELTRACWMRHQEEYRIKASDSATKYYHRNIETIRAKRRSDEYREYQREWKRKHSDGSSARYAANPAPILERNRQWRKDHPEQQAAISASARARRLRAPGSFTTDEWAGLLATYGNRCLACGSTGPLSADHVIPLARGGTGYIANIQPLCRPCNSRKHTKTIDYRNGYRPTDYKDPVLNTS